MTSNVTSQINQEMKFQANQIRQFRLENHKSLSFNSMLQQTPNTV